ncbi:hypothetical protein GpSGHVEth085 [Glossina pallidipes salivary gland hypertrophy virus]|uniref:Uncharacterized protein n=1 Tax=Glossina hytrovirus (isolate Glossina pallidipes/Ethiopia/Seibersdorf/-) TaxID=379529 RepID=A0A109QQ79_GHVS|nr:hypothetical protein GpSGHVEth085 [Glossina pallidipes salivary gland hypertrophy virus]
MNIIFIFFLLLVIIVLFVIYTMLTNPLSFILNKTESKLLRVRLKNPNHIIIF